MLHLQSRLNFICADLQFFCVAGISTASQQAAAISIAISEEGSDTREGSAFLIILICMLCAECTNGIALVEDSSRTTEQEPEQYPPALANAPVWLF